MQTNKQKMLAGELYLANDPELLRDKLRGLKIIRDFNRTTEKQFGQRTKLLRRLFAQTGKALYIEPPFFVDYGCHISVGENFYANFNCVILDVCAVKIGDNVFLGPNVGVYTAAHPIEASVRNTLLEYGRPITIGDNVWIGGSAVINPGVTIGSNTVIGSGSVVTKNIPAGVIAAGNPCKVLRRITKQDKLFWEKQKAAYRRALGPRCRE